ncbi:MAG: LLM class flavin-dependent oxidoreductase [Novosphingobium sp.]|nr:LLM class flavin-dependent oxidoreductase [Novosphingobium sp.]
MYGNALRQAQLAEQLGFDSIWFPDHHFVYSGYLSAQFPIFAACAAVTEKIMLCGGITLLPIQGASRVAEASAAVDAIAPGRLRLALALGYAGREYSSAGIDRKKRGRVFESELEELLTRYADRVGETELWIGAHADVAIRRAARFGLSLFIQQIYDPAELLRVKTMCAEERASSFRSDIVSETRKQRVAIHNVVWAHPDKSAADQARDRWHAMLAHYGTHIMKKEADMQATGVSFDPSQSYLVGSSQQIVDGLAPLITEAGADAIIFHIQTTSATAELVDEQMQTLATEVIPHLRDLK